jgi:hypothetical protein
MDSVYCVFLLNMEGKFPVFSFSCTTWVFTWTPTLRRNLTSVLSVRRGSAATLTWRSTRGSCTAVRNPRLRSLAISSPTRTVLSPVRYIKYICRLSYLCLSFLPFPTILLVYLLSLPINSPTPTVLSLYSPVCKNPLILLSFHFPLFLTFVNRLNSTYRSFPFLQSS